MDLGEAVSGPGPLPDESTHLTRRSGGITRRTLARRLREANTSFSDQLADVRFALARQYLSLGRQSVSEIALRLGFQEPAAFQRAFRRWSGESPSGYRRALCSSPEPEHPALSQKDRIRPDRS
jgi:AraC-like DNA-binding protein